MNNKNNNRIVRGRKYATGGTIPSGLSTGVGGGAQLATLAVDNIFGDDGQYSATDTTNALQARQNAQKAVVTARDNDSLLNQWGNFNAFETTDTSDLYQNKGGAGVKAAKSALTGAAAGAAVGSVIPVIGTAIGAVGGAIIGGVTSLFGSSRKKKKAQRQAAEKAEQLNEQATLANNWALDSFDNAASNISTRNMYSQMANYSAFGGQLPTVGNSALSYELFNRDNNNQTVNNWNQTRLTALPNYTIGYNNEANTLASGGGIHIKKANRGKFTESAKNAGMGTQEFARHVLANKDDYSSTQVKRANFARNASKWHANGGSLQNFPNINPNSFFSNINNSNNMLDNFSTNNPAFDRVVETLANNRTIIGNNVNAEVNEIEAPSISLALGGNLNQSVPNQAQHGGQFSNGVIEIKEGGSHETNPYGGVQMGVDEQGIPNLVEENELVYNDYVFSDRLFAGGGLLNSIGLRNFNNDQSFAKIAKKINEESSERPNDPISKNGLQGNMAKLTLAQEIVKQYQPELQTNQFATGGNFDYSTLMRYAPIVNSAANVLTDSFGVTNRPDYTNVNMIDSTPVAANIATTPVSNFLTYQPLDRNYYQNQLNAQSGATRRAISNNSGGNRGAANAGFLAADFNAVNQSGQLARQAEEYNMNQRMQVENFNRGTNMFNSQNSLQAQTANANIRNSNSQRELQANMARSQMREQIDSIVESNRSQNRSGLATDLGSLGRESVTRNMINNNPALYYDIDNQGNVKYKDGLTTQERKIAKDLLPEFKRNLQNNRMGDFDFLNNYGSNYSGNFSAKGGKINKRRNK